MSASTPTVQGGLRSSQLGAMLLAIVLAIVLVAAVVALQATASRGEAQVAPQPGNVPAFDRGFAAKRGPIFTSPYAVPGDHGWATDAGKVAAPVALPAFDRGWSSDGGALLTPMFSVPGDHSAATEGGAIAAPADTHGGRGTRMAR